MANPLRKYVLALGRLDEIRNYWFVNMNRMRLDSVDQAFYISPSRDYKSPEETCGNFFKTIEPTDTIRIERRGQTVENIFVFILKK